MKRWVLNVVLVLSVILCTLTGMFWVRDYERADAIKWRKKLRGWDPVRVRTLMVRSVRGCVELGMSTEQLLETVEWQPQRWAYEVDNRPRHPAGRGLHQGWSQNPVNFGIMYSRPAGWTDPADGMLFGGITPIYLNMPYSRIESIGAVWVPHWFLVLVFALMPGWKIYGWIKMRRRRRGLCVGCGYDMRGGGERCPECGEAIVIRKSVEAEGVA